MAVIAKLSTGVRPAMDSERQHTTRLGATLAQGAAVKYDANGQFVATSSADAVGAFYGILLEGGIAGEYRTAFAKGKIAGFDLSGLAHGANVFVSATSGSIDTVASGTQTGAVGRVIPGTANGYPTFEKLLEVGL